MLGKITCLLSKSSRRYRQNCQDKTSTLNHWWPFLNPPRSVRAGEAGRLLFIYIVIVVGATLGPSQKLLSIGHAWNSVPTLSWWADRVPQGKRDHVRSSAKIVR
jgi:hypothetical protein